MHCLIGGHFCEATDQKSEGSRFQRDSGRRELHNVGEGRGVLAVLCRDCGGWEECRPEGLKEREERQ